LFEEVRRNYRHVALATMSYCPQVRRVLQILALVDAFDFVASRDDVERSKPGPEIYLLVAAELETRAKWRRKIDSTTQSM
jgi:beta-phosphoglucomutase-like phosphatase (HAD superfamily)